MTISPSLLIIKRTCATTSWFAAKLFSFVIMFTLSYYVAFPPLVKDRCFPLLTSPQNTVLTHKPYYDVIVPYNSSWISEKQPQFSLTGGNDVLVFLHMQKTGGTQVDQFLTQHVKGAPCVCEGHKSCVCNRPTGAKSTERKKSDYDYEREEDDETGAMTGTGQYDTWLYSRSSTYRAGCGVHADWTELTSCVPKLLDQEEKPNPHRRFFYFTILREPVGRFISEWRHVKRGATWKSSKHVCNNQQYHIPTCYNGSDWSGVTMQEFVSCPLNLAFNRQTRMLADLSLVHCYNFSWSPLEHHLQQPALGQETKQELEAKLLHSAKSNLLRMASFGLLSQYEDTQKLLTATLGLEFQRNLKSRKTHSESTLFEPELMTRIEQVNKLDMELFQFATSVFNERLQTLKAAASS